MLSTRNGTRWRREEHHNSTYLDICYSWKLHYRYWPKQRSLSCSPLALFASIRDINSPVADMTGTYRYMPSNLFSTRCNCGSMLLLSNGFKDLRANQILPRRNPNEMMCYGRHGSKGISWDAIKAIQCICVDTDSKMPGAHGAIRLVFRYFFMKY